MNRLITALTLLLATSISPLAGQEVRYGLQGTLSSPTGDLKDTTDHLGFGAGLFADFSLGGGHVIRPRFDYVYYPEKSESFRESGFNAEVKWSVNSAALGADYLYYVEGRPQGFHVLVGLGAMHYEIRAKSSTSFGGTSYSDVFRDKTETKLSYALGFGYDFSKNWGFNLRYTSLKIEDVNLSAFNAGLTYRF